LCGTSARILHIVCNTGNPLPPLLLLLQVSDALLSVLLADVRESLKITATGLKLFERHELRGKEIGKCQYRIAQVGGWAVKVYWALSCVRYY
jgi:hypothetical protein